MFDAQPTSQPTSQVEVWVKVWFLDLNFAHSSSNPPLLKAAFWPPMMEFRWDISLGHFPELSESPSKLFHSVEILRKGHSFASAKKIPLGEFETVSGCPKRAET